MSLGQSLLLGFAICGASMFYAHLAVKRERHRIASHLRALLGQVGGGSDKVMRLVVEAVEGT